MRPVLGVVLKHFTARVIVSRWDVLEPHTRATATTAAGFLDRLVARLPFPVRAIQVDGGPEFQAAFEEACHKLDKHKGLEYSRSCNSEKYQCNGLAGLWEGL